MPDDPTPTPTPNPAESFQRMLAQANNDANSVASRLYDENFRYREQIRDLKTKQPKEGDVVITGDDVKEWNAFKALGVKASDAKKALEAVPTLEKQNKELASMENLREIADIGIDGSKLKLSVLKDQLATKYPDAVISFKTEKDKDGKEAKVAYVQKTDKDPVMSFAEFANADLADYLPALKVTAEATSAPMFGNTPDPQPQNTATGLFDRIRESVKQKSEDNKPADIDSRFGRAATA